MATYTHNERKKVTLVSCLFSMGCASPEKKYKESCCALSIRVVFYVHREGISPNQQPVKQMTPQQIKSSGLSLSKGTRKNRSIIDGSPVTVWRVTAKGEAVATRSTRAAALDLIGSHLLGRDGVKQGDKIKIADGKGYEVATLNWFVDGELNITFADGETLTDSARYYRGKA